MLNIQMERKLPFLQSILAIWCKRMFPSKKVTQAMQYSHHLINVETILPIIFMLVHFTSQEFEMRRFLRMLHYYTIIQLLTIDNYHIHCKWHHPIHFVSTRFFQLLFIYMCYFSFPFQLTCSIDLSSSRALNIRHFVLKLSDNSVNYFRHLKWQKVCA